MGRFLDGRWISDDVDNPEGRFQRQPTTFRDHIGGSSGFPAEAGRYRLYVSYACPWAHRTLIARALLALEGALEVSVVHPHMTDDGWHFDASFPGSTDEPELGASHLRELYKTAREDFTGRVTVPVLWDRAQRTIVNNESLDILRILDRELAGLGDDTVDLFPEGQADEVEAMIQANYEPINNGVYRAGFAGTQEAYEEAVGELFARLDAVDTLLGKQRYLCGDRITAADWCLFTTLLRFDAVYYVHFKCNQRRIVDYPHIWPYVRELYQVPGVAETCRLDHIKHHYYRSHPSLNPKRIIPVGPPLDFEAPHERW